jgi:flagellar biosynthesis activator protein FlaF
MQRRGGYGQGDHLGGASPRETEILAFGLCNARLSKAVEPRERVEALFKTHQLWSLLVRDLASDGNKLPSPLKESLIGLGVWAMNYATAAIARDLPVEPLIEVNRNVADGLRAQNQSQTQARAKPVSEASRPPVMSIAARA